MCVAAQDELLAAAGIDGVAGLHGDRDGVGATFFERVSKGECCRAGLAGVDGEGHRGVLVVDAGGVAVAGEAGQDVVEYGVSGPAGEFGVEAFGSGGRGELEQGAAVFGEVGGVGGQSAEVRVGPQIPHRYGCAEAEFGAEVDGSGGGGVGAVDSATIQEPAGS